MGRTHRRSVPVDTDTYRLTGAETKVLSGNRDGRRICRGEEEEEALGPIAKIRNSHVNHNDAVNMNLRRNWAQTSDGHIVEGLGIRRSIKQVPVALRIPVGCPEQVDPPIFQLRERWLKIFGAAGRAAHIVGEVYFGNEACAIVDRVGVEDIVLEDVR